jgi:hypothetical protein
MSASPFNPDEGRLAMAYAASARGVRLIGELMEEGLTVPEILATLAMAIAVVRQAAASEVAG